MTSPNASGSCRNSCHSHHNEKEIRERDTMNQVRIPIDQVKSYLEEKIKF